MACYRFPEVLRTYSVSNRGIFRALLSLFSLLAGSDNIPLSLCLGEVVPGGSLDGLPLQWLLGQLLAHVPKHTVITELMVTIEKCSDTIAKTLVLILTRNWSPAVIISSGMFVKRCAVLQGWPAST